MESTISCVLDLQYYPMDSHICSIIYHIENVYPEKLILRNIQKELIALQRLTEYIASYRNITLKHNKIIYTINISRQMTFHLFSTYFPTMLMQLIAYSTLFLPDDDFTNRGVFSLTTLLVLISLYSDTLTTLPVTSYLKLIDVWFIFSFSFLSAIIGVHFVSNYVEEKNKNKLKNITARKMSPIKILVISRYFLGTFYVVFFVSYWLFFIL